MGESAPASAEWPSGHHNADGVELNRTTNTKETNDSDLHVRKASESEMLGWDGGSRKRGMLALAQRGAAAAGERCE
jgi:hypothetical protein